MKTFTDVGRYFVVSVCLAPVYILGKVSITLLASDIRHGQAFRFWKIYLFYLFQCIVFGALAWGIATKRSWARYISAAVFALIAIGAGWAAIYPQEGLGRNTPMVVALISALSFIWLVGSGSRSDFQTADGKL